MMESVRKKPVVLVILDGFGIREDKNFNGVLNSNMKNYFSMYNSFPHTHLNASGPLVGLPEGQIGSSEVGHMIIGAGRLIKEPIVRINEDIEDRDFFRNSKLKSGLKFVNHTGGNIHLMGLLGPGGVHSKDVHLYALLDFYDSNIDMVHGQIFIHNFLDGRDTPQKSALVYLKELDEKIRSLKNSNRFFISTVCGRYYAMDRDRRWERTRKAYDLLVQGSANHFKSYDEVISESYRKGVTDEFVEPAILYLKTIKDGDLCVFYNFRSDRPRQLVSAFLDEDFDDFDVKRFINLKFQTMTEYDDNFKVDVFYETTFPKKTFGEILSLNGLKQLRIAESEKFPHVTYFFNGLKQKEFKGEKRIKVLSPKVATYDLQPEMSANEVKDKVISEIKKGRYDFVLINFANSDMVGHTGNYDAVLKAMKTVDGCLGEIKSVLDDVGGLLMITADHGNCETMRDEEGNPHTKHTYNLVPFVLCDKKYHLKKDYMNLSLSNIAPTLCEIMKLKKPKEMTSDSLIK